MTYYKLIFFRYHSKTWSNSRPNVSSLKSTYHNDSCGIDIKLDVQKSLSTLFFVGFWWPWQLRISETFHGKRAAPEVNIKRQFLFHAVSNCGKFFIVTIAYAWMCHNASWDFQVWTRVQWTRCLFCFVNIIEKNEYSQLAAKDGALLSIGQILSAMNCSIKNIVRWVVYQTFQRKNYNLESL